MATALKGRAKEKVKAKPRPRLRGRPSIWSEPLRKVAVFLPENVVRILEKDAIRSGFTHASEQVRYEVLAPRGLFPERKPYLPGRDVPPQKGTR